MDSRGVAAAAALWICLAASALSLAALDGARRAGRRAGARERLVRHLLTGGEMVVALHADQLTTDELLQPPERGGARARRIFFEDRRSALARIAFPDGQEVDVGWVRVGDAWQVQFWRER